MWQLSLQIPNNDKIKINSKQHLKFTSPISQPTVSIQQILHTSINKRPGKLWVWKGRENRFAHKSRTRSSIKRWYPPIAPTRSRPRTSFIFNRCYCTVSVEIMLDLDDLPITHWIIVRPSVVKLLDRRSSKSAILMDGLSSGTDVIFVVWIVGGNCFCNLWFYVCQKWTFVIYGNVFEIN